MASRHFVFTQRRATDWLLQRERYSIIMNELAVGVICHTMGSVVEHWRTTLITHRPTVGNHSQFDNVTTTHDCAFHGAVPNQLPYV